MREAGGVRDWWEWKTVKISRAWAGGWRGFCFTQYLVIFKSNFTFRCSHFKTLASKQPCQNALLCLKQRKKMPKRGEQDRASAPKMLRVTRGARQTLKKKTQIAIIPLGNCCNNRRGWKGREQSGPDSAWEWGRLSQRRGWLGAQGIFVEWLKNSKR